MAKRSRAPARRDPLSNRHAFQPLSVGRPAPRAACRAGTDASHDRLRCKRPRSAAASGLAGRRPCRPEAVTLSMSTVLSHATTSGQRRSRDRCVANAIARRKVAGGRKRPCGPRQPDARDWAGACARLSRRRHMLSVERMRPVVAGKQTSGEEAAGVLVGRPPSAGEIVDSVSARPDGGDLTGRRPAGDMVGVLPRVPVTGAVCEVRLGHGVKSLPARAMAHAARAGSARVRKDQTLRARACGSRGRLPWLPSPGAPRLCVATRLGVPLVQGRTIHRPAPGRLRGAVRHTMWWRVVGLGAVVVLSPVLPPRDSPTGP
jgi:hypothetical protein